MSEESTARHDLVQLTRGWLEAGTSGDPELMLSFWGPDPVWDMSPMRLGVFEGLAAIRSFYADWMGAYEDYRIEAEEIYDLGNGVTFGALLQQGRPIGSGGTVKLRYGSSFGSEHISRIDAYFDADDALKAVGLAE
jgi:hypothetical protein